MNGHRRLVVMVFAAASPQLDSARWMLAKSVLHVHRRHIVGCEEADLVASHHCPTEFPRNSDPNDQTRYIGCLLTLGDIVQNNDCERCAAHLPAIDSGRSC